MASRFSASSPPLPIPSALNSWVFYKIHAIALHWLMLLPIASVHACIELRGDFPKGKAIRKGLKTWHFMLGRSVLVLLFFRAAVHFIGIVPSTQPDPPKWQDLLEKPMHVAPYALMIGMPLLGWLTLSAQGKVVPFFGMSLPQLLGESKSVADWAKELDETVGAIELKSILVYDIPLAW